jgi:alpha-beta hydrolase superfamily lysophospholipase
VRLLDLKDMQARTPLPAPPRGHPPAFVLGAAGDAIVDEEAVRELGRWAGAAPVVLPGMAHDVMLDTRWQEAAAALETWLASHW